MPLKRNLPTQNDVQWEESCSVESCSKDAENCAVITSELQKQVPEEVLACIMNVLDSLDEWQRSNPHKADKD